ncbi:nacrein-like protein [Crassostrea virginica]
MMGHPGLREVFFCCLLRGALGAGYIGTRPATQNKCHYEDVREAHFSYARGFCEGPAQWCDVNQCWSTCGSDERQSPINIDTIQTYRHHFSDLKFINLHKRVPAKISNNGHAPDFDVFVNKNKQSNIILTNVPMRRDRKYIFAQLHAHLGKDDNYNDNYNSDINNHKGSEHSIDDKFYPMEAHMVFYDMTFDNIKTAKAVKDSLVVLGVMIKIREEDEEDNDSDDNSDDDDDDDDEDDGYINIKEYENHKYSNGDCYTSGKANKSYRHNCHKKRSKCKVRFAKRLSDYMEKYYEEIRDHEPVDLDGVDGGGKQYDEFHCGDHPDLGFIYSRCTTNSTKPEKYKTVDCGISPLDALPCDQSFYTYGGSLTTPPCYETVQWVVYKCPIAVSKKAYRNLQLVQDSNKNPLKTLGVRRPVNTHNRNVDVFRNWD